RRQRRPSAQRRPRAASREHTLGPQFCASVVAQGGQVQPTDFSLARRLQLKAAKLDDVSAAVPVRVHVFAATPLRLDHELIGLTEALVEVELDLGGVDTAIRSLTGLIRGLEEGERAAAAPRSLGAHVQLSALLVDDSDRLGRGLYAHAPNGTTIELRYQPRHL